MSSSNYIKNVAIVGASGNSGKWMTLELLKTGKHTVTAITRQESTNELPAGVVVKKVDYSSEDSLVSALQGQDALVITMSPIAPPESQGKLIQAAIRAKVPWILPNEWSPDCTHEGMCQDVPIFGFKKAVNRGIADSGTSAFIAVTTGFWYQWSLGIADSFGFDIKTRHVTYFDDGKTPINTSSLPQVGRAVAGLLTLPISPLPNSDPAKCLEHFKNQQVRVSSFLVSQQDMLESLLRVTGTSESDWTISHEPSKERWAKGTEAMKQGDHSGFVRQMYARVFYPNGGGDFESTKGTHNEMLGLPVESIDKATQEAVEGKDGRPAKYGKN